MALKKYKPSTPSQRGLVLVDHSELHRGKPVKSLTQGLNKNGGRNNAGRITVRRRGGGHKRSYRMVDFKRRKFDMAATVERLEYDPNRSAFIALVKYEDGTLSYILAPQRLGAGDKIIAGENVDVKPGNAMPLQSIPIGTIIHNIELKPGQGRPDCAFGWRICPAGWPRPSLCDYSLGLWRAKIGAWHLHGNGWRGVKP